jgi:hypothetical protein
MEADFKPGRLQVEVQELIEFAFDVIAERCAILEAMFSIEGECRFESAAGSRFEAETLVIPRAGNPDDFQKDTFSNPSSCESRVGAHRLDLAMPVIEFLQRATPQ